MSLFLLIVKINIYFQNEITLMLTFENFQNTYKSSKEFRNDFYQKIKKLKDDRDWFVKSDQLGLASILDEFLKSVSQFVDGNKIKKYQYPLSLLYRARKAEVVKINDKYYCPRFKRNMIYIDGEWSWLNKISSNVNFLFNLLCDYFAFLYNDNLGFKKIAYSILDYDMNKLKNFIKKCVYLDEEKYGINFLIYVGYKYNNPFDLIEKAKCVKKNTLTGNEYEQKASITIMERGWKILYEGGHGDLIDIILGIDFIIQKENCIKTVQVKSCPVDQINTKRYKNIDVFIGFSKTGELEFKSA